MMTQDDKDSFNRLLNELAQKSVDSNPDCATWILKKDPKVIQGFISLPDNLLYCMSLFKSKQRELIYKGREQLLHIFPYQMEDGLFPRYLHEFTQYSSSEASRSMAYALLAILLFHEAALGEGVHQVKEVLERLVISYTKKYPIKESISHLPIHYLSAYLKNSSYPSLPSDLELCKQSYSFLIELATIEHLTQQLKYDFFWKKVAILNDPDLGKINRLPWKAMEVKRRPKSFLDYWFNPRVERLKEEGETTLSLYNNLLHDTGYFPDYEKEVVQFLSQEKIYSYQAELDEESYLQITTHSSLEAASSTYKKSSSLLEGALSIKDKAYDFFLRAPFGHSISKVDQKEGSLFISSSYSYVPNSKGGESLPSQEVPIWSLLMKKDQKLSWLYEGELFSALPLTRDHPAVICSKFEEIVLELTISVDCEIYLHQIPDVKYRSKGNFIELNPNYSHLFLRILDETKPLNGSVCWEFKRDKK